MALEHETSQKNIDKRKESYVNFIFLHSVCRYAPFKHGNTGAMAKKSLIQWISDNLLKKLWKICLANKKNAGRTKERQIY